MPDDILELVLASRRGQEAYGELVARVRPWLVRVVRRRLRRRLQAKVCPDDVVQEVFAQGRGLIDRFGGRTEREFKAWLLAIAVNRLRDVGRHYATRKRDVQRELPLAVSDSSAAAAMPVPLVDSTPSSQVRRNERRQLVLRGIDQLDNAQRQVVLLHWWYQLSMRQIGFVMDRSEEAVKKLHQGAVARLRAQLGGCGDSHKE